jgi:hypothetical protein
MKKIINTLILASIMRHAKVNGSNTKLKMIMDFAKHVLKTRN